MKLYVSPGACSLSPHIVMREAGLSFELEKVDIRAHKTASGADYYGINPKGYVPALDIGTGPILTEGPVIGQYLADQKPESKLAPPAGTIERYRMQEWLNFIGTEIHKTYSPMFRPDITPEARQAALDKLTHRYEYVVKELGDQPYLLGEQFTVADAYLFVMLNWAQRMGPDLAKQSTLKAFWERVRTRPAVKAALEAEEKLRS